MKASTVIIIILGVVILFNAPISCTQPDKATEILKAHGYTDIQITGYRPFMASDSDTFSTGFTAKSPSGQRVSGAVTSGFLKGSTIRFD